MGIGTDNQIARAHDALLGQQRVLDAHATDLVVMRDALLTGEIAHLLGLLGAFDVLVRNVVIGNQGDLGGIEHLLHADLLEILNGDRRRDVVGSTRSRLHSINCPGSTSSSPACAAKIFSAMVMGRAMFAPSIYSLACPYTGHFVKLVDCTTSVSRKYGRAPSGLFFVTILFTFANARHA